MRAFEYSLSEAWASLWRGRRSGILSVATIALALFVLGGFLVLTVNLERLVVEYLGQSDQRDQQPLEHRYSREQLEQPADRQSLEQLGQWRAWPLERLRPRVGQRLVRARLVG